ncbi:UNVERIFIED_CONTAM: snRNA-activating protein complex subunit [Sesamum radiatum]|uniref:snRNA-activating protein complex subunit n=1 Tax=Sesamum radiatum TaxID=300843 RepID=A0AAW2LS65_SESRA
MSAMLMGHDEGGEDHHVSIPLGGPIYVRDMVGPLIRAPTSKILCFKNFRYSISCFVSLNASLKEELSGDSLDTCDEEILVDELKIIGEDELVNKAFEEAFKEGELAIDASQVTEEHLSPRSDACIFLAKNGSLHGLGRVEILNQTMQLAGFEIASGIFAQQEFGCCGFEFTRRTDDNGTSGPENGGLHNSDGDMKAIVSSECSNVLPLRGCRDKKSNKNHSGKRKKRRHEREEDNSFDESYIAKVEELARIKQKQEEQKAAVRLHSFDSSKVPGSAAMAKADKIRSLKSASVSTKGGLSFFNSSEESVFGYIFCDLVRASKTCDNVPVQFPEAVLCFEVYHNRKTWLKTQEFLVLGRQFLTEVRDKIYCLTDEIMKKAGHNDPSGYFLIEDVFYNDMRDCSAMDYSKPILDWLENSKNDALEKWEFIVSGELQQKQKALLGRQSKQQLPRLKSAHMQTTRFCDIRFRLGAGYLYCHQGDCKHVIVIRDLRLIHPEDVQNRAAYPLLTLQQKFRYRKCSVCKIYRAAKMTVDDKWPCRTPVISVTFVIICFTMQTGLCSTVISPSMIIIMNDYYYLNKNFYWI